MTTAAQDLSRYRLERAQETLDDARLLADAGRWNSCVNRLYYACFYAASALLLKHGLTSSKHSGIRSFFNLHFVKTGKVLPELGRLYNDLFTQRQEGDYADLTGFDEDTVRPWIPRAAEFVDAITVLTLADSEAAEKPEPDAPAPKG